MSAARSRARRPGHSLQQNWEKIAGFTFGVMFVAAMLVLAIAFPQPTSFQYEVFRIVLAIACGGVAAVIPGFLAVSMDTKGLGIRVGGALAVFLLVYFFSPARLVSSTAEMKLSEIKQDTENIHQQGQIIIQEVNKIKELLTPLENTAYRELVATVIHSFEPKSDIKIGSWLQGPDGARNIDIEVRSTIDGIRKLMVIEVVDLPGDRKARVEIIDGLDSKRADIQADIALVCSNTGFDAIAIRKAKRKQIGLISVLRRGDPRVKAIIEEEIYLRKIRLGPMKINYTGPHTEDNLAINFEFHLHDLRYQGKSVAAWLQQRAAIIATSQPEPSQPITLKFNLKTITEFEIKDRHVSLNTLSITFHPQTQWLAQTVRLDASTGIYDYLRGRVRLARGTNSYMIDGVDFDSATPLPTPPALKDLGIGLIPGEVDISLTMVEGLDLPSGMEIPKLEDIIRPEDLEFKWTLSGTPAPTPSTPHNTEQSSQEK